MKTLLIKTTTLFALFSLIAIQSCFAQETMKHNFGLGVGTITTSSTNQFLKYSNDSPTNGIKYGEIDKNIDLNLSFIYEYSLKSNMSLGINPTYRLNRAEITRVVNPNYIVIGDNKATYTSHDLDIPLYFDYKLHLFSNLNLITGIGASAMVNLDINDWNTKRKDITPYGLLRLGFEAKANHKIQFMIKYRWNISKDAYYYNNLNKKESFRLNTFDVGINIFL
ncbi:MAG: outer membrane beta-barrel protein [Bacteroidales bacterium]|nr:outer membrane beta-barrel protein [Bacteroidales bacterium]